MTTTLVRWTVEDYHTMIAAGLFLNRQVELLNGQVVEMSPEGPLHADLNRDLGDWFRDQLGQRARVSEGKPITLNDGSEPQPDVAIVR
ncbi:MAG: Uma2 family endonuclease, partial [Pseudanabaenales cyanobacterium]|nr:Uma2 family endonuclease [Pseudanabaenales cyanobacterium]